MANTTKELIARALLQLAREKPVEKITVKDIVKLCGVNRNTFYYHFQDIPDVVDFLMRQQVDYLSSQRRKDETLSSFSLRFMDYLVAHKKTVLHVYKSLRRETFLHYLHELLAYMADCLKDSPEISALTEDELQELKFFSICIMEGTIFEWLASDMNEEIYEKCKRVSRLLSQASPQLMALLLKNK